MIVVKRNPPRIIVDAPKIPARPTYPEHWKGRPKVSPATLRKMREWQAPKGKEKS